MANDWAATKGVSVEVVQKEQGDIRSQVRTVAPETAPDVMIAAHDWVGELSSNGSIVPLNPSAALKKQFPAAALDAFSYGVAVKRQYGVPLYVENVALITNLRLAKVPTTWASPEAQAQAAKKKTKAPVAIAVQQGSGGDAYHMYPFFTSLCGYIFGKNSAATSILRHRRREQGFLANAPVIDRWNKSGLIRSTVTDGIAKTLFTTGKTAYYITGAWNLDDIKKSGLRFAISPFPNNKCKTTPFTGYGGLAVTKFASTHGVESLAKDFVANYMMQAGPQFTHYTVGSRLPANTVAAGRIKDVPEGLRQRRRYRQPDAEHPPDGVGVERPRPGVGSLDEGCWLDPGPQVVRRRAEEHRAQDRLVSTETGGGARGTRPFTS